MGCNEEGLVRISWSCSLDIRVDPSDQLLGVWV